MNLIETKTPEADAELIKRITKMAALKKQFREFGMYPYMYADLLRKEIKDIFNEYEA